MFVLRAASLLCVLGVARTAGTNASVSPVQKIIALLAEMKSKTAADLADGERSFSEFTKFCSDGTREKKQAIKTAKRQLEDLEATINEASANIETYEAEVTELTSQISDKERELGEAKRLREHEHSDFKTTEKELLESLRQLSSAYDVVKKKGSSGAAFLQGGKSSLSLRQQLEGFQKLIDSALLTGKQRGSLVHLKEIAPAQPSDDADGDLDFDESIQAQRLKDSTSFLESKEPDGILHTLKEMRDKAEKQLSDCRTAESDSAHAFSMLKQGLEDELKNHKADLAESQSNKSAAQEASAKASEENEAIEKTKTGDEEFLESLGKECQLKAQEFEERQRSGKEEIDALTKATEILEGGVKAAFVQLSSRAHRASSSMLVSRAHMRARTHEQSRHLRVAFAEDNYNDIPSGGDELRVANMRLKLVSKLHDLATSTRSSALLQLADRAQADPFVKIRGLIKDMIDKLMSEGAAEAEKKAFCDAEMGKSKAAKSSKTGKLKKLSARLDESESAKATLTASIKQLEGELAEIDALQKEATQLRNEDHAEFLKAQSDYKSSEDACAKAVAVLKEYYEGASFLQVSMRTRRFNDEEVAAQSSPGAGSQIIEFLMLAEEDFAKLLAEVESAEAKAVEEYNTLTQENKVGKATKAMEIKGKASEIKGLTRALNSNEEDKEGLEKELSAVNAYLDKLKPQCETKSMSYEEKVSAREAEVEGLKDALSMLDGSGL